MNSLWIPMEILYSLPQNQQPQCSINQPWEEHSIHGYKIPIVQFLKCIKRQRLAWYPWLYINSTIHFRESCVFMGQYGNNIVFGTQVSEIWKTSVNVEIYIRFMHSKPTVFFLPSLPLQVSTSAAHLSSGDFYNPNNSNSEKNKFPYILWKINSLETAFLLQNQTPQPSLKLKTNAEPSFLSSIVSLSSIPWF